MFLWVAGVSILFGFALVGSIFLTQMLLFNERVLKEKDRTVAVLKSNNSNVNELESQIRVLDTNQALISAKSSSEDRAVQVILDALPSDANSLALGASIQNKLLANIAGITLNSLQVDPVPGVESLNGETLIQSASSVASTYQNEITFRFSVSGNEVALKQVLTNLELSIRAIDVISLKIEGQGSTTVLSVQARAFYEPARIVQLKDKTVK
jgi:phosphotransferase system HPr-like phosphotransfer protein